MRVDELDEPSLVRWYCLSGHPEWARTTIEFSLEPGTEGTTLVNFKHLGWRSTETFDQYGDEILEFEIK